MAKVRKKFKYKNKYSHGGVHNPYDELTMPSDNTSVRNLSGPFQEVDFQKLEEEEVSGTQEEQKLENEMEEIRSFYNERVNPFDGTLKPAVNDFVPPPLATGAITPDNNPALALAPSKIFTIPAGQVYKYGIKPISNFLGRTGKDIARKFGEYEAAVAANKLKPGAVTDEALDAANTYNKMWFDSSETQRRINQVFGSPYQVNRPMQPFGQAMREGIENQGYLTSYPSLKGAEGALDGIYNPINHIKGTIKRPIVDVGNAGQSSVPIMYHMENNLLVNPLQDLNAMKALHGDMNLYAGQNFVSRAVQDPIRRMYTGIHEGLHGITTRGFYNLDDDAYQTLASKIRKPFKKKGLKLTDDGKIIDYRTGNMDDISGEMYDNYILDPQEIYARVQEIRHHAMITPSQRNLTGEQLHAALTDSKGNYLPEIGKNVRNLIDKSKSFKDLAELINYLPATTGVAATGYGLSQQNDNTMNKYERGGFFKKTKVGRKLRDFGVATVNTALSPIEGALGTDFGFDEKHGYRTKFGETIGGIGEGIGSAVGAVGAQALNTVVPGSTLALQGIGSGLEGAGITQNQTGAGSIGAQAGNLYGMMNPDQVQKMSGIFMRPETPSIPLTKQGAMNYKYKKGGMAQSPDIEAESGEILLTQGGKIQSLNPKAGLNNLGEGAYEIKGEQPHSKGGVNMVLPPGETTVVTNLKGRSSRVKSLYAKIAQANKKIKSTDFIERQQGELEKRNAMAQVQEEVSQQQKDNGNKTNMARYGGRYMKAKNGMVSQTPPKTGPKTYHEYLGGMTEEGLIGLDYERNLNDPNLQLYTRPPLMDYAYQKYMDDLTRMKSPEAVAREYDKKGDSFMAGRYRKYTGRGVPFINQKDGGRIMKAQDGVVFGSLNPGTQAYQYFMNNPAGPYSTTQGRLYSGEQNMPGDVTGRAFDRQMGYREQQGNQVMYPQYGTPEQLSAMYGTSAQSPQVTQVPQVSGIPNQGQGQTPSVNQGAANNTQVPNMGDVPGAHTFNQMNPQFDPNQYSPEVPNMGTVPGANTFNELYGGPNPNQFSGPPNQEQPYVDQSFGVNMSDQNPAPVMGPINQQQPIGNEDSFGVLMDDMNPAPVMGPENMPEGYGDTAAADQFLANNPDLSYQGVGQNQVTQDPIDPNGERKGLGQYVPYASAAYNIGAGIAGLINPPEQFNASDYQLSGRMRPNKIDPYSQISPSLQIAATALGANPDPRRRQAMASSMAPGISQSFGRTNYLNKQLENEAQRFNFGIDRYNAGIQGKFDMMNRQIAAQPMNFLKEGFGQAANTYLALDQNDMMRNLSNTPRFNQGQYIGS